MHFLFAHPFFKLAIKIDPCKPKVKLRLTDLKWLKISKMFNELHHNDLFDDKINLHSLRICWKNMKARAKNHFLFHINELLLYDIDITKIEWRDILEHCHMKFRSQEKKRISAILLCEMPDIFRNILLEFVQKKIRKPKLEDIWQIMSPSIQHSEIFPTERKIPNQYHSSEYHLSNPLDLNEKKTSDPILLPQLYSKFSQPHNQQADMKYYSNFQNRNSHYILPFNNVAPSPNQEPQNSNMQFNKSSFSFTPKKHVNFNMDYCNNNNNNMISPSIMPPPGLNTLLDTNKYQFTKYEEQRKQQMLMNQTRHINNFVNYNQLNSGYTDTAVQKHTLYESQYHTINYETKIPKLNNFISYIDLPENNEKYNEYFPTQFISNFGKY
ncbi:MAG: hypothetical protein MHMPM18_003338 [Marteilia pararefringens]